MAMKNEMIYTVTLNPSIDYEVICAPIVSGGLVRAERERISAGGKGINVSLVLRELGQQSIALGFAGGFTGAEIERRLRAEGIKTDFCRVDGDSRINIKIISGEQSEINGRGPRITDGDVSALIKKLGAAGRGDVIVLSGSAPAQSPPDAGERILSAAKGAEVVVDAEGEALLRLLKFRPLLVKPNLSELEGIAKRPLDTLEEIFFEAEKLRALGAKNVLVSLGGRGAALLDERKGRFFAETPPGRAQGTTGAGDSMVAGFIAAWYNNYLSEKALALATAAGSATAFSRGLCKKADILRLFDAIKVRRL